MDPLASINRDPIYLEIDSNQYLLELELKVLKLVKEIKIIISTYKVTGKEVVNRSGDGHYQQCPEAKSLTFSDVCICCKIQHKKTQVGYLLDEIRKIKQEIRFHPLENETNL